MIGEANNGKPKHEVKIMETEEKKIVWLPKELAAKVEDAESQDTADKLVLRYCEQVRGDMTESISCLDDDLLSFKGKMATVRQEFGKAKEAHLNAIYEVWEKQEVDMAKVRATSAQLIDKLRPLRTEVDGINAELGKINTHKIERLLEMVSAIGDHLAMNSETGNILQFLTENYERKD